MSPLPDPERTPRTPRTPRAPYRYGAYVALGAVPILLLALFAYLLTSRAVQRQVQAGNDATVVMTAAFVDRTFERWEFTLASYAGFPVLSSAVAAGDLAEVRRRLELIVEEQPEIDRAFVTDTTGLLWADYSEAPESHGRRFQNRDWYRGVARLRGPYVSEVYVRHARPRRPVVSVAAPVHDPETGEMSGILVAQVLPDGISEVMRRAGSGAGATAFLLDPRGTVAAHPTLDLGNDLVRDYRDALPELSSPEGELARREYRDPLTGDAVVASAMGVTVGGQRWLVVTQQPVRQAFGPVRTIAAQLAGAGLLLALLLAGLTLVLVRENARRGRAERELIAMNERLESRVEARTEELRKAEEELNHARKLEAVGRLAGGIAHDFNNLLVVILGSAQYLLEDVPEDSPMREDLEALHSAGERAAELTRQLLAFSRKQVMNAVVLDVDEAIRGMQGILERVIGENVDLVFRLSTDLHPVKFDPGQIEQVVMNLVINAKDAMPRGGEIVIETENVELDEDYVREHPEVRPGPHVVLAISDTGEGMDAETRERIFEPFFSTKDRGRGTGLGLSTVYGIVKQGGGDIWVESAPGEGATFRICLPRTEEATEEPAGDIAAGTGTDTGTVLVVEDDEGVRALVVRALERAGFTVLEAEDGQSAKSLCRAHDGPVDLLLTDVILPDTGGPQLASDLGADRGRLKTLYMSGHADERIGHYGIPAEGAFIEKPFRARDLLERVREVMAAG